MATQPTEDATDVRTAQFGLYPDIEDPFAVICTDDEDPEMPANILDMIQSHVDHCDGVERELVERAGLEGGMEPAGEVVYEPGRMTGQVRYVTLYTDAGEE